MMPMNRNELRAVVQLDAVKGFGHARLRRLFSDLQSIETDLRHLPEFSESDLIGLLHFTQDQARQFHEAANHTDRFVDSEDLDGVELLTRFHDEWDMLVKARSSSDLPPWLFILGLRNLLLSPAISIGGSRGATPNSIRLTHEISARAVREGFTVVSGGARGVDQTAHGAAIAAGGQTIVVLAQGHGTFRIPETWSDALHVGQLAIVSEFVPMADWGAYRAMQRNKTVIRLADSMVVVQSGPKGGTLNAGHATLHMNVPLFVVTQVGEGAEAFVGNQELNSRGRKGVALTCIRRHT
jgi:predicted Rossmann fold nucleotide-binding protein DprA/Smf involved in DNA uptake